jgi:hypothetical protein
MAVALSAAACGGGSDDSASTGGASAADTFAFCAESTKADTAWDSAIERLDEDTSPGELKKAIQPALATYKDLAKKAPSELNDAVQQWRAAITDLENTLAKTNYNPRTETELGVLEVALDRMSSARLPIAAWATVNCPE